MTTTVLQFLEPTKNFKVTKKETIGLELSDISLLTKNIKNKSSYINGKYIIIGVPDDRGIIENGGNPGAKQGPDVFRLCFYKLYDTQVQKFNKSIDSYDDNQTISKKNPEFISNYFFDAGNIILADSILETHDRLASVVEFFLNHGAKVYGWVLLDKVKLGYELWRQINGFPPDFNDQIKSQSFINYEK